MVSAEATEDPESAANPVQPSTVPWASPPFIWPTPGVGGVVEIAAHPGRAGHVAHQHEEGNDRELIEDCRAPGLGDQGRKRCRPTVQDSESDEAHRDHGDGDRNPLAHQEENEHKAGNAEEGRIHARSTPAGVRASLLPACGELQRQTGGNPKRLHAQDNGLKRGSSGQHPEKGLERNFDHVGCFVE